MVARSSRARPSASSAPQQQQPKVVVPRITTDPVWSLRPWPLVIEVLGEEHEIPAMPATEWLQYLMQPEVDLDGILFNLVPRCEELLCDNEVDLDEVYQLCLDIIAGVSGRSWWITLRLIQVVRESWNNVGARSIIKGVDPNTLSLSAWLDAIFLIMLENMEPRDANSFTMKLEMPPLELVQGEELMDEMEMSQGAFFALGVD